MVHTTFDAPLEGESLVCACYDDDDLARLKSVRFC
jgi:hypothetical protein